MSVPCPICHFTSSILLDRRLRAPLLQNRVWPDRASARAAPTGELDFVLCPACGFAWNRAFSPDRMAYGREYNNDQAGSPRFRTHLAAMIEIMLTHVSNGNPAHLVEIGCGQGAFLAQLARTKYFASLTGFDPAWRGVDGVETGGVTIHRCYFGPAALDLVPHNSSFFVSRHTIEHIADPLAFLRDIRACMGASDNGRLFLETPDIEWIIRTFQPHDLFYEHCSIFSRDGLQVALAASGFEQVSIARVFDEQYLWAEAAPATNERHIEGRCEFVCEATCFAARRARFVDDWRNQIAGTTYLWGAASKGVTFALLTDPDGSRLAGAIDVNQEKIGKFLPCTGLPIFSPTVLRDGDTVIVMNPNYRDEIADHIKAIGISARLLSLASDETRSAG
jgi:hypothetical protein